MGFGLESERHVYYPGSKRGSCSTPIEWELVAALLFVSQPMNELGLELEERARL
jgi:hypothetical protein